jgi:hypothetical protein
MCGPISKAIRARSLPMIIEFLEFAKLLLAKDTRESIQAAIATLRRSPEWIRTGCGS